MPFYRMAPGFGGDCHANHHGPQGRRHTFHHGHPFHHGPPHGHPFHGPPHGPPPHTKPMFGRRGHRFMMQFKDPNETTADETEGPDSNPCSDSNPHPRAGKCHRGRHDGRRRRGGPRGNCINRESPEETKTEEPEVSESHEQPEHCPPPFWLLPRHHGRGFHHHHGPPGPTHFHRHSKQIHKKLMTMLLAQQRAMEEHEQKHKNSHHHNASDASAPTESCANSILQVPQQWHIQETGKSLVLSIDVAGFDLQNLELKVEQSILTLFGHRTNRLGDVFELSRSMMLDPIVYNEAGIEARCDNQDNNTDDSNILSITIPKKEHASENGSIPIRTAEESLNPSEDEEAASDALVTTPVTFMEPTGKGLAENLAERLEDSIFVPEAEIVFEPSEEATTGVQVTVETVEEASSIAPEELASAVLENDSATSQSEASLETTQSWEDLIVDDAKE